MLVKSSLPIVARKTTGERHLLRISSSFIRFVAFAGAFALKMAGPLAERGPKVRCAVWFRLVLRRLGPFFVDKGGFSPAVAKASYFRSPICHKRAIFWRCSPIALPCVGSGAALSLCAVRILRGCKCFVLCGCWRCCPIVLRCAGSGAVCCMSVGAVAPPSSLCVVRSLLPRLVLRGGGLARWTGSAGLPSRFCGGWSYFNTRIGRCSSCRRLRCCSRCWRRR